jgi:hypothetical protein
MSASAYLKASKRDIFQWECEETTDGIGFGGVARESVSMNGCNAHITREKEDEFEIDVILNHPIMYDGEETYEVIDYRASRKSARMLAERLIKNDLKKDVEISEVQLGRMKHCLGLDFGKKPYRNRYVTYFKDEVWEDLVEMNLAKFYDTKYELTKFGVEFVLGRNVSDKTYSEL